MKTPEMKAFPWWGKDISDNNTIFQTRISLVQFRII
jgi:hypothetical protein